MNDYFVEIVHQTTGEVARRMGPMSEHKADKVEMGALMNLDRDNWFVRVVEPQTEATGTGAAA